MAEMIGIAPRDEFRYAASLTKCSSLRENEEGF
jgi:hypothetical protein